ncbi:hypothetical protein SteCoe_3296 [Stentor coeruleus]|uniref:Dynein regulatory complex subunit 3 n=1 Tax=Stentor coeruleus TaxID=5963 RepID=A0A1R2CXI9_9CILI|nr:hypothetical protein SteCoe_3296 [Stentor coeruleus]
MVDKDNYEVSFFKNVGKKKADTVDPNVINDELIKKYIKEFNLENKIFGLDDMPFSELLELKLSFQNILKIQNLRGLTKLKKLCLDNNIITKIEGLGEELAEIEWLDLSFNNISVVEGLDNLISLTDLSLFHNLIKVVDSGLDKCERLNLLSLGDNKISDREPTVGYLRKLPHLQVLKLEGNEMCNDQYYKSYVMAHLSNLKYLDYILIDPQEVIKAKEEHREELLLKENLERPDEDQERRKKEAEKKEQLDEAFLSITDNILENVQEECKEEEKKIKVLPEQDALFDTFCEKFKDGLTSFQNKIIGMNEIRLQMISKFKQSVKNAEEENEKEDIRHISDYERKEKNSLRTFELSEQDEAAEEILKAIFPEVDSLENILIDKELQLVERINEAIDRFEKNLKTTVDSIKDECKNFQEEMNKEVEVYFQDIDRIKDEELKKFFAENANLDAFTPEQREVYTDRDGLNNAISTLAEEYKNMVFSIEEETNKAYDEELESFITTFKDEKHDRNRQHIREIMELVTEKRKKIQVTLEAT